MRLAQGEATVGELAALPAISRQLRVLEGASLIVRERPGPRRICGLRPEALAEASEWLEITHWFWTGAFWTHVAT